MFNASVLTSCFRGPLNRLNSAQREDGMATSNGLHAWADTLRRWGELVDTTEILVVAGVAVIIGLGLHILGVI